MTQPLRIILADDHEAIRQGIRALFATSSDVVVIDDVGDVERAIERVHELDPDVLLLDLSMPKAGGLEAIRRLADEGSRTAVIVLTRYREEAFVREAVAAGAAGYVLKQSPFSEVQQAIAHAARGEPYIDSGLASVFERGHAFDVPQAMTKREREVLRA